MKIEIVSAKTIGEAATGTSVTAKKLGTLLAKLDGPEARGMEAWAADPANDGLGMVEFQAAFAAVLTRVVEGEANPDKAMAAILTFFVRRSGGIIRVIED